MNNQKSQESLKMQQLRLEVQREINQQRIRIDRKIFSKSPDQKKELWAGKRGWITNRFKNETQAEVFNHIASFVTDPNFKLKFGSLTLIQLEHDH